MNWAARRAGLGHRPPPSAAPHPRHPSGQPGHAPRGHRHDVRPSQPAHDPHATPASPTSTVADEYATASAKVDALYTQPAAPTQRRGRHAPSARRTSPHARQRLVHPPRRHSTAAYETICEGCGYYPPPSSSPPPCEPKPTTPPPTTSRCEPSSTNTSSTMPKRQPDERRPPTSPTRADRSLTSTARQCCTTRCTPSPCCAPRCMKATPAPRCTPSSASSTKHAARCRTRRRGPRPRPHLGRDRGPTRHHTTGRHHPLRRTDQHQEDAPRPRLTLTHRDRAGLTQPPRSAAYPVVT